jgi:hypothetical protein
MSRNQRSTARGISKDSEVTMAKPSSAFANIVTPLEYTQRADPPPIYTTVPAVQWALRQHRAELAQAGALVVVRGRILLDVPRFEAAMVEIGRGLARRGAGV